MSISYPPDNEQAGARHRRETLSKQALKGDRAAIQALLDEFGGLCSELSNARLRAYHLARHRTDPLPFLVLRRRSAGLRTLYLGDGADNGGFSERGLFLLWRAGDRHAGEFFCERMLASLYRMVAGEARRRGKLHALDDCFQEFFINLATRSRHLEKAASCDDQTFLIHCQWELRYTVMGSEAVRAAPENAVEIQDQRPTPPDLLERQEQNHRMFAFLSSRTCRVPENIRENLILFNLGFTHEAINILTGTPANTSKNRCREAKLLWDKHEAKGVAPGTAGEGFSIAALDAHAAAWEAKALDNRQLLQESFFRKIDPLISTRDASLKVEIQGLLEQPARTDDARRDLLASGRVPLTHGEFAEVLGFLGRLRAMDDCEAREAVLLWDLARCPLSSIVLYTVHIHRVAGADPLEIVFERWQRGARLLLAEDWRGG